MPLISDKRQHVEKLVRCSKWRLIVTLLFSCSIVSDSLRPHGLQHTRLPYTIFMKIDIDNLPLYCAILRVLFHYT